jgi:hypothetical protein
VVDRSGIRLAANLTGLPETRSPAALYRKPWLASTAERATPTSNHPALRDPPRWNPLSAAHDETLSGSRDLAAEFPGFRLLDALCSRVQDLVALRVGLCGWEPVDGAT